VTAAVSPAGTAPWRVRLEGFEGPLDLLLTLVQRQSLDITTLALAQVTDQYLAHLAGLEAVDAAAMAEFCEVAATLIVLKSRALLPRPPAPEPDELADAEALAERLRQYRRVRQAAELLGERERSGLRAFARAVPPPELPPRLEPGEVSPAQLALAFEAALAEAAAASPAPAGAPAVRPDPVRLADRVAHIRDLLGRRERVTFREVLIGDRPSREFVVVSFLAVLELLRRRAVRVVQEELFGEILIQRRLDEAGLRAQADAAAEESFLDEP
jgi:segregation and condensation protein A